MTIAKDGSNVLDQYDEIEEVATTATFVNTLTINSIGIRESHLIIHNNAGGDLDYEVLGNNRDPSLIVAPTGTNDDDKGWVNVVTPASIATTVAPDEINITNTYTQVIVRIKHTTATTNVDIWHRGEQ